MGGAASAAVACQDWAMERLLWVDAPHFYAAAVWQRRPDGWHCVDAAPVLRWMVGKPPAEVGAYLRRKGWQFGWTPQNSPSAG